MTGYEKAQALFVCAGIVSLLCTALELAILFILLSFIPFILGFGKSR